MTALLARMAGPQPYDAEEFSGHLSDHLRRLGAAFSSFEGALAMMDARISVATAMMSSKIPGATAEDMAIARQMLEEARLRSEGSIAQKTKRVATPSGGCQPGCVGKGGGREVLCITKTNLLGWIPMWTNPAQQIRCGA